MNAATLDSALHWLMRTSLEASVLILVVLGLRTLLGARLEPAWRIGLWVLVGAKLLLPACIPAGFGLGGWAQSGLVASLPLRHEITEDPMNDLNSALNVSAQEVVTPSNQATFSRAHALFVIWAVGAFSILGWAFWRQRHFDRQLAQAPHGEDAALLSVVREVKRLAGVKAEVQVRLLPPGSTPAVTGLRRPQVLLPADWDMCFDAASLRHVLLHELLHVRHRDLWWNWAMLLVQALHWFNPLVWCIGSRFQADRELRCDAAVLRLLSPNERWAYGHTLLRIQETFFAPPVMAGVASCVRNHPSLLQRISMIAQPHRNHPWLHAVFTLAFGVITCYAFTTAHAAEEKALPVKERSREGERGALSHEAEKSPRASREGDGKMTGEGDGLKRSDMRDREDTKTGPRDGDRPKTTERDGERPKSGPRDGDKPHSGERDGERPKSSERDHPKSGSEEREGRRKNADVRNSENASGETLNLRVTQNGERVIIGQEEVAMNRLRGHLQSFLPEHPGAQVIVRGDSGVPYKALAEAMDAVRDNGNKNVKIQAD
ncbi:M56 family metallopeptidase [Prosthecobacter dejongeii]|uniref:Beta-lactamase regulating signal transducer with metallopeptidase domain n=1 Tax=Prosthecobacter dejongeii TaxID=48465 RepID=A0A7W7YI49_9BACT|nr:M56 family metallopeptidase [Prosthecobacter dejongeii]MBB5036549.1 beta-lactamase regulating signal transducer with metallopeptidase domain [Prosthecobacter dejongeii]